MNKFRICKFLHTQFSYLGNRKKLFCNQS